MLNLQMFLVYILVYKVITCLHWVSSSSLESHVSPDSLISPSLSPSPFCMNVIRCAMNIIRSYLKKQPSFDSIHSILTRFTLRNCINKYLYINIRHPVFKGEDFPTCVFVDHT